MKKIIIRTFLLFAALAITVGLNAQKFGYIDSNGILAEMPAVKEMRSNLEALQTQLQKQGQKMLQEYQQQEQAFVQERERGTLSPVQEETKLQELQKKQEEILKAEKDMSQQLIDKENSLLEPILKQVNDAIKAVADENGYQFIFEASVLLYAEPAQDVSELVRQKLGM